MKPQFNFLLIFLGLNFFYQLSFSQSQNQFRRALRSLKDLDYHTFYSRDTEGNARDLDKKLKAIIDDLPAKTIRSKVIEALIWQKRLLAKTTIFEKDNRNRDNQFFSAIKRSRTIFHEFDNKDEIFDQLEREDTYWFRLFELNPNDIDGLYRLAIMPLKDEILTSEQVLYEGVTQSQGFNDIMSYIRNYGCYKIGNRFYESSVAYEKFKMLFNWYTLDGEERTMLDFVNKYQGSEVMNTYFLIEKLQKDPVWEKKKKRFEQGRNLLQESAPDEYVVEDFIREAAPSGLAFSALQKLVNRNPESSTAYLETFQIYFCNGSEPFFEEACSDFNHFKNNWEARINQDLAEYRVIETDFLGYNPFEFQVSRNGNYILFTPYIQGYEVMSVVSIRLSGGSRAYPLAIPS